MRGAPPLLDARVDRHSGAQCGVLDGLEQRQRDGDLVAQRRVLRVAERDEQEVRGDEGRVLGVREPDRGVEHGRVERAAGERDEDAPGTGMRTAQPEAAAHHEGAGQHGASAASAMTAAIIPRQPVPVGPVRDDADVEAGQLAHHAGEKRAAEDLAAARLVGRADEDVGRAALGGDAPHVVDEVVSLLLEEVHAEDAGQAAQSRELRRLLLGRRPRSGAPRARPCPCRTAAPSARRGA